MKTLDDEVIVTMKGKKNAKVANTASFRYPTFPRERKHPVFTSPTLFVFFVISGFFILCIQTKD